MRKAGLLAKAAGSLAVLGLLGGTSGTAFATSRPAAPKASGSPVVICALASLSGPYQIISQGELTGWNSYVKWVDSHGGILGHPVKMVVENDGSQASLAVALVRKCVTQDHANFIIGPGGTSDAAAAIPVADAMHVVMEEATSGWHALGLSKSDLQSYGFPSIDNVFLLDDLDTVTKLIVPRHYTRVAVIQESDPGGRLNSTYMKAFGQQDHFKVVAVQTVTPGSTDDTPQVLNLLAAKPQIIVLGMAPGPDTITVLKAVRAQNPDIPISECSGCSLPSFLAAAGGVSVMHNVYSLGTVLNLQQALPNTGANRPLLSQISTVISAMKSAGYGTTEDIVNGAGSWDTMLELQAAIKAAHGLNENAVRNALEHLHTNTLGIQWARTPANHSGMTSVVDVMGTFNEAGQFQLYGGATKVSISKATANES